MLLLKGIPFILGSAFWPPCCWKLAPKSFRTQPLSSLFSRALGGSFDKFGLLFVGVLIVSSMLGLLILRSSHVSWDPVSQMVDYSEDPVRVPFPNEVPKSHGICGSCAQTPEQYLAYVVTTTGSPETWPPQCLLGLSGILC